MLDRIGFFRHAFLQHTPQRRAIMLQPEAGIKYRDLPGSITDQELAAHIAGQASYAAPAAHAGLSALLPLDIDSGGLPAIQALLAAAAERDLWAFGQYCPRPQWPDAEQRGYVWIVASELVAAQRLQQLGQELIDQVDPAYRIESRATEADTRLPLARHTHTGRFGYLALSDQIIEIDRDPAAAYHLLAHQLTPATPAQLPALQEPKQTGAGQRPQASASTIDIQRFNADNDLVELLSSYGAKAVSRRLMLCPFHPDEHASLALFQSKNGQTLCHCKSKHSHCPLTRVSDAFQVFCIGEGLTPQEALRRLNNIPEGPPTKAGPQTPPAAPGRTKNSPPYRKIPPATEGAAPQANQPATSNSMSQQGAKQGILLAALMDTTLTAKTRDVFRAMVELAPGLNAYQSITQYATNAGASPRTTRTAIRTLEQRGYLERIHDRGLDGQTNIYRLTLPHTRGGEGGKFLPPHESRDHDHGVKHDLTGRGGQSPRKPQASAVGPKAKPVPAPQAHDLELYSYSCDAELEGYATHLAAQAHQVEAHQVEAHQVEARDSHRWNWGTFSATADDQADIQADAASYDPRAAMVQPDRPGQRCQWSSDLSPKELYTTIHGMRHMYERMQLRDQGDEVEAIELPPAPPVPAPPRRVPPSDPAKREKYYKLMGAAKKTKSASQRQRLRDLATVLMEEAEQQAGGLPPPTCSSSRVEQAFLFGDMPEGGSAAKGQKGGRTSYDMWRSFA